MKKRKGIFTLIVLLGLITAISGAAQIFTETTSLQDSKQMYGSAALGDYLYIIGGGGSKGYTNSVYMSRIGTDGHLGPWQATRALPHNRSYIGNSCLALNDRLYVIGGYDGSANRNLSTVLVTQPGPDGHLAPWKESISFPGGNELSCLNAVATPGFIHILGGYTKDDQPTNVVISGRLGPSGDIMQWLAGPPLPKPLWFHNAAVMGGRVWIWGGLTTPEPDIGSVSREVYSAPILASGLIGGWRQESQSLPVGIYRGTCTSVGAYLITFCPSYAEGLLSSDVYYTSLQGSGIGPWQKLQTGLPVKNYLGCAPDFRRSNIYIPGGRVAKDSTIPIDGRVFFFHVYGSEDTRKTAQSSSASSGYTFNSEQNLPSGAISGFMPLGQARFFARQNQLPIVVYYQIPGAKNCLRQEAALSESGILSSYTGRVVFAWVNVRDFPQQAQQMGVFRTPSWFFYNSDGSFSARQDSIVPNNQLNQYLQKLR